MGQSLDLIIYLYISRFLSSTYVTKWVEYLLPSLVHDLQLQDNRLLSCVVSCYTYCAYIRGLGILWMTARRERERERPSISRRRAVLFVSVRRSGEALHRHSQSLASAASGPAWRHPLMVSSLGLLHGKISFPLSVIPLLASFS